MNADDAVVLAVLSGLNPPLTVHDGNVEDSNPNDKVITADLPYVVFYGGSDDDSLGDSLAGTSGSYLTEFRLNFVGSTREQAKLAGERAAAAINRKFLTFGRGPRFVRRTDNSQDVRRDDTWTRPGGKPLFYGSDQYAVGI